jgi:hypothetical protein
MTTATPTAASDLRSFGNKRAGCRISESRLILGSSSRSRSGLHGCGKFSFKFAGSQPKRHSGVLGLE